MLEDKEKLATMGSGQRSGDETKMAQGYETRERERSEVLDHVVKRVKKSEPRKGQWFVA